MKSRPEIKLQAKSSFKAQYGISVGAYILIMFLIGAASGITFGIGTLFLAPPLIVGYASFAVRVYRGEKGDIGEMFSAGFNDYGRNLGGVLWMWLFTWLWSLLFIIPGIIKFFSYFMTPYILADSKKVSATEALKLSMRMTKGYKGKIFVMYLSFIGWAILSGLTFGILQLVYVGPYMQTSLAGIYAELKNNAIASGTVTAAELE
jgi:uncharacterized membrane protein